MEKYLKEFKKEEKKTNFFSSINSTAIAIDVSGSTSGEVMENQKKIISNILSGTNCEGLKNNIIAWDNDAKIKPLHADVACLGERADDLGGGTNNAQDPTVGVELGQIVLLDGTKGFGRGGVAAQNDQLAAHGEEFLDGLARELIDDIERAWTVGGPCIVAQVQIVVLGKQLAYAVQDGQSAIATVENADGNPFHYFIISFFHFPASA